MDINLLTLHITILLLLSTYTCAARLTKEGKARPRQALVLCGDSFVKAWIRVCKLKHQSQRGRKKRNVYNIHGMILIFVILLFPYVSIIVLKSTVLTFQKHWRFFLVYSSRKSKHNAVARILKKFTFLDYTSINFLLTIKELLHIREKWPPINKHIWFQHETRQTT